MLGFVIFEILPSKILPLGLIENYNYLMYTDYDNEVGSFTLEIPYTKESFELVRRDDGKEKLILLDNRYQKFVFGICHKVNPKFDATEKTIQIQGTLIEGLLDNYCIGKIERLKTSDVLPQKLLNFPLSLQYILRNLPDNLAGSFWSGITYSLPIDYQDTSWVFEDGYIGGRCTFGDYIGSCSRQLKKAYSLEYNQGTGKFALNLYSPKNRTTGQQNNSPVLFSTSFGDILSSSYYLNSKAYKNVVVAYTNLEENYYEQIVSYDNMDNTYPIEKRRVVYSEALNISKYDENGNEISAEDINGLLRQFGKETLYDAELCSEYSCRFSQNSMYTYGVDYQLGDIITIQDKELDITLDAKVSGYSVTSSMSSENFEPILGVSQPSLTRILKKKGVI